MPIVSDRLRAQFWCIRDMLRDGLLGSAHRRSVFNHIYSQNLWGDCESTSGTGSSHSATSVVRQQLPTLLSDYGIRTLLDAPCGDLSWVRELITVPERYIGIDIVPALIERNTALFESASVSFVCADICVDSLPAADLVLCRDCFIHLPTRLIYRALRNFRSTGARFLLLTNDAEAEPYRDIPVGSFRPIDFTRAPFGFPLPLFVIAENDHGRQLCLWDLQTLLSHE